MLSLTEGAVLGGGAFSRVSVVTEDSTGRSYAMKRMRKSAVVQCPEHVFCEQVRPARPGPAGGGRVRLPHLAIGPGHGGQGVPGVAWVLRSCAVLS